MVFSYDLVGSVMCIVFNFFVINWYVVGDFGIVIVYILVGLMEVKIVLLVYCGDLVLF